MVVRSTGVSPERKGRQEPSKWWSHSPPNSDGGYNVYKLRHLGTGRVAAYNVKDIIPYISKEAP